MPGYPYTTYRKNDSVIIAAKASLSRFTGYRIEADPTLPSQTNLLRGSRQPDPLAGIFEEKVVPILMETPYFRPISLFDEFLRRRNAAQQKFGRSMYSEPTTSRYSPLGLRG